MIQDRDGIMLKLAEIPNAHYLILGKSGMGKTFFQCRQIEVAIQKGQRMLVVDFSGSFTKKELRRARLNGAEHIQYIDITDAAVHIPYLTRDKNLDAERLTKAFAEAFDITGHIQRRILKQLFYHLWNAERVKLQEMFEYLEIMRLETLDVDAEKARRIEGLMDRLQCLEENCPVVIESFRENFISEKTVTVLQLSDIPLEIRMKYAELILELIWDMIQKNGMYQRIVLDEIQHLDCGRSKALSAMMREGRKYDLGLMISTQFIDTKDKAKTETLMQAANILFFKPTLGATRSTARLIDTEHVEEWREILEHLKVGECVLKGCFFIGKMNKIHDTPIVCKVVENVFDTGNGGGYNR